MVDFIENFRGTGAKKWRERRQNKNAKANENPRSKRPWMLKIQQIINYTKWNNQLEAFEIQILRSLIVYI